jgi:hypothetical protein
MRHSRQLSIVAALGLGLLPASCEDNDKPQALVMPNMPSGGTGGGGAVPEPPEGGTGPGPAQGGAASAGDAGAPPVAPIDPATPANKRVFVTSTSYHGDLQSQGGGADGLDGADRLCGESAATAGLGGTWLAWVSTSEADALSRLPVGVRWTLIDGSTEVFPSRGAISMGPSHAIDTDEQGATVSASGAAFPTVWTNTDRFGRNSVEGQNDACDDWAGQTGVAAVGAIFDPALGGALGLSWTDTRQPRACGSEHRLYCFEM